MTSEYLELQDSMSTTTTKQAEPRRVRGTATFHDDMSVEFTPQGEGEPVQKNVRKKGGSRFYETEGRKESSIVAHLKIPRDTPDPAAALEEELDFFIRGMRLKEPSATCKGKLLMDESDAKVWHNRVKQEVVVRVVVPTTVPDVSTYLLTAIANVNKCLYINKASLTPPRK